MGRMVLMVAAFLSLISSADARGAVKCNLKHYPNLACEPQQVRWVCDRSSRCYWIFDCAPELQLPLHGPSKDRSEPARRSD
jgi:hypothetical protein